MTRMKNIQRRVDEYAPDYHKLCPGVTIAPAVMKALNQSGRKIQYFELDLKTDRERITRAQRLSPWLRLARAR